MSIAANADLVIDQGADFFVQMYWTNYQNMPFTVLSPMRMQIKADTGQVVAELIYHETPVTGEDPTILYNQETGLIQLQLTSTVTDTLMPGLYDYDLFVSYADSQPSPKVRRVRLLFGKVEVRGKVTASV